MSEKKLNKEIGFNKNNQYPTKTRVNLVRDEQKKHNRNAIIGFVVFMLCLGLFVRFFVVERLNQVNVMEQQYQAMAAQVEAMRQANQEYDEVKAQYDAVTDWYMSDEEKMEVDKNDVFAMIDQDIMSYVEVQSVSISGRTVTVQTGNTTLANVSHFVNILKRDSRNGYVTVTTANATNQEANNNYVTASVVITYGSEGSVSE